MAKKKAAPAPADKSTKPKPAKVVKRRGVNKSKAIREYLKANPNDGPTAVCAALAKKGIKVTPPQVSNVKSIDAKKSGVKPMKRKRGPAPKSSSSEKVSLSALVETSTFIDKVGGVGAAKELIAALEKISK